MSKGKNRSLRFEEELEQKIENHEGNSFSDKLQNILIDYYSKDREKYLINLEERIEDKLKHLKLLDEDLQKINKLIRDISWNRY